MDRVLKTITTLTPAGTNIPGLVPYPGLDFELEIQIWRGGVHQINANVLAAGINVVPGDNPSNGDIKFAPTEPDLYPGEVLEVRVATMQATAAIAPRFDTNTNNLECLVWAEKGGSTLEDPESASLTVKKGADIHIHTFPLNTSPTVDGVFTFSVASLVLERDTIYTFDAIVNLPGPKVIKAKRAHHLL